MKYIYYKIIYNYNCKKSRNEFYFKNFFKMFININIKNK